MLKHFGLLQQKLQPLLPTLGLHSDAHALWTHAQDIFRDIAKLLWMKKFLAPSCDE